MLEFFLKKFYLELIYGHMYFKGRHNIFPEKNLLWVNTLLKNVVCSDMIMHRYSYTSSLHLEYE